MTKVWYKLCRYKCCFMKHENMCSYIWNILSVLFLTQYEVKALHNNVLLGLYTVPSDGMAHRGRGDWSGEVGRPFISHDKFTAEPECHGMEDWCPGAKVMLTYLVHCFCCVEWATWDKKKQVIGQNAELLESFRHYLHILDVLLLVKLLCIAIMMSTTSQKKLNILTNMWLRCKVLGYTHSNYNLYCFNIKGCLILDFDYLILVSAISSSLCPCSHGSWQS